MQSSLLFHILRNSVTSIKRYNQLLLLRNKTVGIYFFFWIGIMALAQGFHAGIYQVPRFFVAITTSIDTIVERYPEDLMFKWDGNAVITSSYETLEIAYPPNFDATEYALPAHLAQFISTEVENPAESHSNYYLVATPTQLHIQEGPEFWSRISYAEVLAEVPSTSITIEMVRALGELWHENVGSLQKYTQIIVGIGATILTIVGKVFTLLIEAIFMYLIVNFLARIKATYQKMMKLGALFMVPATIVQTGVIYLYGSDHYGLGGFTFWLLFVLYMWFGKVTMRSDKQQ